MKRILYIMVLTLGLVGILVGCSNNPKSIEQKLTLGSYVMEAESADALKPFLILKEDNEFSFTYSYLSSYWPVGLYIEEGNILTLNTSDGKYKYVFKIENNALIFNSNESAEIPIYAEVPDGAIFSFNKD
ncbi:MAG: hypothetical protein RBR71_11110 [Gudongella sp.]|jgi:hypothetical protein|nr:hypothetical protein [Gudongella sp.]